MAEEDATWRRLIRSPIVGYDLPEGWGQRIVPFWMAAGLAAAILGIVAKGPGRRGVLVVPFMIGALVLTFWLGEVLVLHSPRE